MEIAKKICAFVATILFIHLPATVMAAKTEMATFAGGCFWSMQHDLDKVPGVIKTTVGAWLKLTDLNTLPH